MCDGVMVHVTTVCDGTCVYVQVVTRNNEFQKGSGFVDVVEKKCFIRTTNARSYAKTIG